MTHEERWRELVPDQASRDVFEEQLLLCGRDFLPPHAVAVFDGGPRSEEYWEWLCDQWTGCPDEGDVIVYSNGLIHCSVCAPKGMSPARVAKRTNMVNPTGVTPWKVSEENFASGEKNPCACNGDEDRLHYLMVC